MEDISVLSQKDDEQMELPPGFRFHPTDEELITHYLSPKVLDNNFCARAIGEVDLNKVEPWDLPWKAKLGEKEWYFFCVRDRKYPTGMRTNRATEAGYWKATGKDREIFKVKTLVGMKKTLVFYKGRAPRGEKTNWVMHEYRLEGNNSMHNLHKTAKSGWVICRIFNKTSGGKKIHISGIFRPSNHGNDSRYSNIPVLLDISSYEGQTTASLAETSHVPCFTNHMEDQKPLDTMGHNISTNVLGPSTLKFSDFSNSSIILPKPSTPIPFLSPESPQTFVENVNYTDSAWMRENSILKLLLQNNGPCQNRNGKTEFSHNNIGISTDLSVSNHGMSLRPYENLPITSAGPADIECLCDY